MLNKNKNMFIDTLTHLKSDYLKMVDDPEIRLSFVDTILLALKEDIKNTNLLNETVISDSFEKSLHNILIAIEKDIRKSFIEYKMSYSEDALKIIWDEKIKFTHFMVFVCYCVFTFINAYSHTWLIIFKGFK